MAIPLTGIKAGNVQVPDAGGTLYVHNYAAFFAELFYASYAVYDTRTLKYPTLPFAVKDIIQGIDGTPDLTSYTLNFPRSVTFDADSGGCWLKYQDPKPGATILLPSFQIIKA